MSTVSSSLSPGLQALSNAGLLPSNLTSEQLKNASPSQLTQSVIDNVKLTTVSSLFGETTQSSDTVSLSDNVTSALFGSTTSSSSTDSLLQALDSALASAGSATTDSEATSSSSNTALAGSGTLFSYMG